MESESSTDTLKAMKQAETEFGLSLLASTLAHEIRNPLQSIRLLIEAAQRGSAILPVLKQLTEQVNRLETVVDRVQKLGQKYEIQAETLNLRELLDAALSSLNFWLSASGTMVRTHIQWEGEPYCEGDRELLTQVLLNLFMNSIQAMPDGGILTVSIFEEADSACIEVVDTGKGIPTNVVKLVGTPFFTTKEEGHGLGLAFCKTIASLHQGSIDLESKEGEGTKVTLRIQKRHASASEVSHV